MVLLNACCASVVSASASSKKITLNGTFPNAFVLANPLTFSRTILIPRSSEAFNSK